METYGCIQDHMDLIPRNICPLRHPIPHRPVMGRFNRLAPNYPADHPPVIQIVMVSSERMSANLWLSVTGVHMSVPLIIRSQNLVTAHIIGPHMPSHSFIVHYIRPCILLVQSISPSACHIPSNLSLFPVVPRPSSLFSRLSSRSHLVSCLVSFSILPSCLVSHFLSSSCPPTHTHRLRHYTLSWSCPSTTPLGSSCIFPGHIISPPSDDLPACTPAMKTPTNECMHIYMQAHTSM